MAVIQMFSEDRVPAVIIYHDDAHYFSITLAEVVDYLYGSLVEGGSVNLVDLMSTPISSVMKAGVGVIEEDTPMDAVIHYITEHRGGGGGGEPVGALSLEDLMAWGSDYFKPSSPLALVIMDNGSWQVFDRHVFEENLPHELNEELFDLFAPAIKTIGEMMEEILRDSGEMKSFQKEKYTVLFQSMPPVTGLLFCTNDNLDSRCRLKLCLERYWSKNGAQFSAPELVTRKPDVPVSNFAQMFVV
ncbi:MAG: hypothetical protein ACTSU5_09190 [Promethearchaeota archaeon]